MDKFDLPSGLVVTANGRYMLYADHLEAIAECQEKLEAKKWVVQVLDKEVKRLNDFLKQRG